MIIEVRRSRDFQFQLYTFSQCRRRRIIGEIGLAVHCRATNEPNNAIMGNDIAHHDTEPRQDFAFSLLFLRIGRL
jgi:hypothetical protein